MAYWHITAELDHETGEGAGADGTIEVTNLEDDEGNDDRLGGRRRALPQHRRIEASDCTRVTARQVTEEEE